MTDVDAAALHRLLADLQAIPTVTWDELYNHFASLRYGNLKEQKSYYDNKSVKWIRADDLAAVLSQLSEKEETKDDLRAILADMEATADKWTDPTLEPQAVAMYSFVRILECLLPKNVEAARGSGRATPVDSRTAPTNELTTTDREQLSAVCEHVLRDGEWGAVNVPMDGTHAGRFVRFTRADVVALKTKLTAPATTHEPTVTGWQPIATAPKNGTEVLLMVERRAGISHKCLVGHHMAGGHCIEDHPAIDEGWYFWNGCMFDLASKPILWAPLPPLPAPPGAAVRVMTKEEKEQAHDDQSRVDSKG